MAIGTSAVDTSDSSSQHGAPEFKDPHDTSMDEAGGCWYMSRKEIEENYPSRRDGIDLKKETYFRKLYCTFLQDLGMRLKVLVRARPREEVLAEKGQDWKKIDEQLDSLKIKEIGAEGSEKRVWQERECLGGEN